MFDINVLADIYLKREPFALNSSRAVSLVGEGTVDGVICGHAVTTLYYVLRKQLGPGSAATLVIELLSLMEVAQQPKAVFRMAHSYGTTDFEDAVTAATSLAHGCISVVTRDGIGFRNTPVATITPSELCQRFV